MASNLPSCPGGTLYNIRPGDTFFNIAARFGVTVHDLMRANPRVDPNNLRICDLICVPAQLFGYGWRYSILHCCKI